MSLHTVFIHDGDAKLTLYDYAINNGYISIALERKYVETRSFLDSPPDKAICYVIDTMDDFSFMLIASKIRREFKDASIMDVNDVHRCHRLTFDGKHCTGEPELSSYYCSQHRQVGSQRDEKYLEVLSGFNPDRTGMSNKLQFIRSSEAF